MSMQPAEFPAGVSWVVTRQEPDQVSFDLPGDPVYGVSVYFVTAAGNRGAVFVPNDRYHDLRAVHKLIAAKAATADAISNMTSANF